MIGRATQANGIRYFRKCAAKTAALGERETSLGLENVPLGARGVSTPLGQNDARDGRSSQRPTSRICRRFMSSSIAVASSPRCTGGQPARPRMKPDIVTALGFARALATPAVLAETA